jgi:hypothetical protein
MLRAMYYENDEASIISTSPSARTLCQLPAAAGGHWHGRLCPLAWGQGAHDRPAWILGT